jgi:urocanate hydratase
MIELRDQPNQLSVHREGTGMGASEMTALKMVVDGTLIVLKVSSERMGHGEGA